MLHNFHLRCKFSTRPQCANQKRLSRIFNPDFHCCTLQVNSLLQNPGRGSTACHEFRHCVRDTHAAHVFRAPEKKCLRSQKLGWPHIFHKISFLSRCAPTHESHRTPWHIHSGGLLVPAGHKRSNRISLKSSNLSRDDGFTRLRQPQHNQLLHQQDRKERMQQQIKCMVVVIRDFAAALPKSKSKRTRSGIFGPMSLPPSWIS